MWSVENQGNDEKEPNDILKLKETTKSRIRVQPQILIRRAINLNRLFPRSKTTDGSRIVPISTESPIDN